MCVVSAKVKFCTCASNSIQELMHYWILHRFNKDKHVTIVGEIILPVTHDENYKSNEVTFSTRLNELDAFDTNLEFKKNDVLEIVLNNLSEDTDHWIFYFRYSNKQWKVTKSGFFELESNYDEIKFGKFRHLK